MPGIHLLIKEAPEKGGKKMNKVTTRGQAANKPFLTHAMAWLEAHPKVTIALLLITVSIVPGIIETFLP
jgi:hypothetical protein